MKPSSSGQRPPEPFLPEEAPPGARRDPVSTLVPGPSPLRWPGLLTSFFVGSFFVQAMLDVDWGRLSVWQSQLSYRWVSGTVLGGYLLFQWWLSLSRVMNARRAAKRLFALHQQSGWLGPVLLFVHSVRLGAGYLLVLSGSWLTVHTLALLSPHAFRGWRRLWLTPWLVSHIALAAVVSVLALYHIWIALSFE